MMCASTALRGYHWNHLAQPCGGPSVLREVIGVLEGLGFAVKTGANLYRDTYGYLASEQERADDLNQMVADPGGQADPVRRRGRAATSCCP